MSTKFPFPYHAVLVLLAIIFALGCSRPEPDTPTPSSVACAEPAVEITGNTAQVIAGEEIILSAQGIGTDLTYAWLAQGHVIPDSNSPSIIYTVPEDVDLVSVSVQVTNFCNRSAEDTVELKVETPLTETPTPDLTATAQVAAETAAAEVAMRQAEQTATAQASSETATAQTVETATAEAATTQAITIETAQAGETATTTAATATAIARTQVAQAPPTFTPVPPLLPPPVIGGSSYFRATNQVCFSWSWNYSLEADWYYAVRIDESNGIPVSRVWSEVNNVCLDVSEAGLGSGPHSWYVLVIKDLDGDRTGANGGWIDISQHSSTGTVVIDFEPTNEPP